MKFSRLEGIVMSYANMKETNAAYNGAWNDGGASGCRSAIERFKQDLVNKYDLRPSEYSKLNDVEVGEPSQFSEEIEAERKRLARNIKL